MRPLLTGSRNRNLLQVVLASSVMKQHSRSLLPLRSVPPVTHTLPHRLQHNRLPLAGPLRTGHPPLKLTKTMIFNHGYQSHLVK